MSNNTLKQRYVAKFLNTIAVIVICALVAFLLLYSGDTHAGQLKFTGGKSCPNLTQEQKDVIDFSYLSGYEHDLGLTMAAIALKESSAGKYLVNPRTGDYGIYQGNWKTICDQAGFKRTSLSCSKEVQEVITDKNKAASHALKTLKYWKNYHKTRTTKNRYQKMIRSYNGGFYWLRPKAVIATEDYYNKFRKSFKIVKDCFTEV